MKETVSALEVDNEFVQTNDLFSVKTVDIMAKVAKETLFLVSSAGTGFFYTLVKNKRKVKGEKKFSMMKYDPIAQKKVLFEQKSKLSRLKKKFVKDVAETTVEAEA